MAVMLKLMGQIFASRRLDVARARCKAAGLTEAQTLELLPFIFGEVTEAHRSGLETAARAAELSRAAAVPTVQIVLTRVAEDIADAAPTKKPGDTN